MTITTQHLQTLEKQVWTWRNYKVQYTVMGTGQPLVLIHGFGASIGHWRKISRFWLRLVIRCLL